MEQNFIMYEYKEIIIDKTEGFILDGYLSFGFEIVSKTEQRKDKVLLRRDRNLINRQELLRLQRNFESDLVKLKNLERSKTRNAKIVAYVLGFLGICFFAGATFAVTATPPLIWLCVFLAIPAFILCTIPYFIYKYMVKNKLKNLEDEKEIVYGDIFNVCTKARSILQ